jgi:plasmid segregation protein ParM
MLIFNNSTCLFLLIFVLAPKAKESYIINVLTSMEFDIITVPSLLETSQSSLERTATCLVKGLRLKDGDSFYIVGELAENEGKMPHKEINCSPDSLDYNILLKSSLLVANSMRGNPLTITTGFPFATYRLNRELALKNLLSNHIIEFDAATYSNSGVRKMVVEIKSGEILPEVTAASQAVRKLNKVDHDFFMLSLGYGTFETLFSTRDGEFSTQRAASSAPGIVYAVDLLRDELNSLQYTSMQNDYYFDKALQNGFIFLNRRKTDVSGIRKKVLNTYYDNIISPHIKRSFTDKEFSKAKSIYLSGGGALYPELVDRFKEEFADFIEVIVPDSPNYLAVKGYCLNSVRLTGGDSSQSIGIDLGNSSTIICMMKSSIQSQ